MTRTASTWMWAGAVLLFLGIGFSCNHGQDEAEVVFLEEPAYFVPMSQPENKPFRPEVAALGRALFYDPILSADSSVSCASCHQQEKAFTDGRARSIGVNGQVGSRNSISLGNAGYRYKGLFWDGRAATLEASVTHPLTNPKEMGADWTMVIERLQQHSRYAGRFEEVFGEEVSRDHVEQALAQFMRQLISAGSKFDRVLQGKDTFSESEERGFHLFFDSSTELPDAECGHCHTDPLFTSLEYANNGIEPIHDLEAFPDPGRGGVSGHAWDRGKFRIPSLRNVAFTGPYMHDGRIETLEEVIDHYASGGHVQKNTSPNVRKLRLDDQHKTDLIAFLHTLSDTAFIIDHRFSNPHPGAKPLIE